ncbi:MAG: four-helix bundle copper-binding protein [Magnetospirillum sp.]|nr:four-helix bundle copper-binding protein [Magnetospirillum sp.]
MSMRDCIDACEDAHRLCTETAIHGMQQGGHLADWSLVQILLDAADITETAADFLARSSRMHHLTCRAAAEVADKCADSCEQHASDDLRMKECAEALRRCATQCRKLL